MQEITGCFTLTSGRSKGVIYSNCCKKICYYEQKSNKNHCNCCEEEININDCRTVDAKWDERKKGYNDLSCFNNPKITEVGARKLMFIIQDYVRPEEDKQKYFNLIRQYSYKAASFGVTKLAYGIEKNDNIINKLAYLSKILREDRINA